MKSIKQIAIELETTPQNVYLRLKQNNIPLSELRGKKQGRTTVFDEAAEARIKEIFQDTSKQPDNKETRYKEAIETIERLKKDLEEEQKATAAAREELAAAQEEITRLQGVERQLMGQVSNLIETEKARLMIEAAKTSRIPSATNGDKPGLMKRFIGLLRGNKGEQEKE